MQSPRILKKKLRSPESAVNFKTSVTCTEVPESLFDASLAKKHFSKFGRIQRIKLFPKRHACIIEYDQPVSAERAVLNAGAYDGFMFEVTKTKPKLKRRIKKDDDPDWLPDSDVEEELSAMGGAPTYRITRNNQTEVGSKQMVTTPKKKITQSPFQKKVSTTRPAVISQSPSRTESPVQSSVTQTSLNTVEAAKELHLLRLKVSLSPDEQWRILDARDKILRSWGGAGSRVKVNGATIGTCPDMCPEKERLHRQAEHQVMSLETVPDCDWQLDPLRAVKQYSRSSADQEIPMCYELRPASVLMRTCAYLLHNIADTTRQISLPDWFHFMWDRFRGIRKDITQQALCCKESIQLVEMCARFHAHCAARLADLDYTQFDQKLNTDNLTKCLQTLKHMYADVSQELKPREAEFRGYIALLNLGDANFWWEIKQLPEYIQKSEPVVFAIKIFNALDNNNYIRFFRLVKEKATYLQACILLRYFNDVRARALARIVKAYAPRGGSRYPAEDIMNSLCFESIESMRSFISNYGLRFAKTDEYELTVILDRNQFIEDSDPYPISRAINLVEKKCNSNIGTVIAGGQLPPENFKDMKIYSSFTKDGILKECALIAEDQGYNTINDSNKDMKALKTELKKILESETGSITFANSIYTKRVQSDLDSQKTFKTISLPDVKNTFLFKPAIPIASLDVINHSSENKFKEKSFFTFSKPKEPISFFEETTSSLSTKEKKVADNIESKTNIKKPMEVTQILKDDGVKYSKSLFSKENDVKESENTSKGLFGNLRHNIFSTKEVATSKIQMGEANKNIFASHQDEMKSKHSNSIFQTGVNNIFSKSVASGTHINSKPTIFGNFSSKNPFASNAVVKSEIQTNLFKNEEIKNSEESKLSPGTIFKSAICKVQSSDSKPYSIFQSKNKPLVVNNIFTSVHSDQKNKIYDYEQSVEQSEIIEREELLKEEEHSKKEEERRQQEEHQKKIERQKEIECQKEEKRQKEEKQLMEKKKDQEDRHKTQEELVMLERRKLEELELKRKIEEKRKAEEIEKIKERESEEVTSDLLNEITDETVKEIMNDEYQKYKKLINCACEVTNEIIDHLCNEICISEMKAEKYLTDKLMKSWFYRWRKIVKRNRKRRDLLENTPMWLSHTPTEIASCLRRSVEKAALNNMNAIHKGYRFSGEIKNIANSEPLNIIEIIKTPILKRMKQICYPPDKCFFWKITLATSDTRKWFYRKIDIDKWVKTAFSNERDSEVSDSLIRVEKKSMKNHSVEFATSFGFVSSNTNSNEAIHGTNGILFYLNDESDFFSAESLQLILKSKYPLQIVPIAIVMPMSCHESIVNEIERQLTYQVEIKVISAYKLFKVDFVNTHSSLKYCTKHALRWLAKHFPLIPNLETDLLKSVCQKYLSSEIWYRLNSETNDNRLKVISEDLNSMVQFYNTAVNKLTEVITNEDLFNYPTFPLEFQKYLDSTSPYPKPYEFIPSDARNCGIVSVIKDVMNKLKLQQPKPEFVPKHVVDVQEQLQGYCEQIGLVKTQDDVCKTLSVLSNKLCDVTMPCEQVVEEAKLNHYELQHILRLIISESINQLQNIESIQVIYDKSALKMYCDMHWLHDTNVFSKIKHKAFNDEDDIDAFINAKRRKIMEDSIEYLMLEENDFTLVEDSIKTTNISIQKFSECEDTLMSIEAQLEEEQKKSLEFENYLKTALSDI